jgi:hypothetical protein
VGRRRYGVHKPVTAMFAFELHLSKWVDTVEKVADEKIAAPHLSF